MDELTHDELMAIKNALEQLILDGVAINNDDPIVTAFQKIQDIIQGIQNLLFILNPDAIGKIPVYLTKKMLKLQRLLLAGISLMFAK